MALFKWWDKQKKQWDEPDLPVADTVDCVNGLVRFRCEDELTLGPNTFSVPLPDQELPAQAKFLVESYMMEEELWVGRVLDPLEIGHRLAQLFPPAEEEEQLPTWEEKRSVLRVQRSLGVMCRQFQGFKGLTFDLTEKGVRFISDGPQELGAVLDIRMEIDDARVPAMEFKAEVLWCLPRDDKFQFGCLMRLSPEQQEVLTKFLDFFRNYTDEVFYEKYARD